MMGYSALLCSNIILCEKSVLCLYLRFILATDRIGVPCIIKLVRPLDKPFHRRPPLFQN